MPDSIRHPPGGVLNQVQDDAVPVTTAWCGSRRRSAVQGGMVRLTTAHVQPAILLHLDVRGAAEQEAALSISTLGTHPANTNKVSKCRS